MKTDYDANYDVDVLIITMGMIDDGKFRLPKRFTKNHKMISVKIYQDYSTPPRLWDQNI